GAGAVAAGDGPGPRPAGTDAAAARRPTAVGAGVAAAAGRGRRGAGRAHLPGGRLALRVGTVLHLPDVVEHVPGDPAQGVPRRPAPLDHRRPVGRPPQRPGDVLAQGLDGPGVAQVRLGVLDPELAGVRGLGAVHVVEHFFGGAAPAPRALAGYSRGWL